MKTIFAEAQKNYHLIRSFQKNPYHFFDQVKPTNGKDIVKVRLGLKDYYFCYHPDHARYILQENKKNYPKSDLVLKKILALSGPQGLIQLNDNDAKEVRNFASKLMAPDKTQRLSEFVSSFVEEEYDNFDKAAKYGHIIDLKPFLTQIVLRTAGIFILNEDIQARAEKLNESFVELNRMAGESLRSMFPAPYSRNKAQHLKRIHDELELILKEKQNKNEVSLLNELLKAKYPHSFIKDQVKAFMFAGYDTTASSLIFAVDSIARNVDIQNKVYKERSLNYRSAHYTQAVYKESLRLYPSAYFLPRQAKKDDSIDGERIASGDQVFISIRHVQKSPEIYEKPNEFKPERFLEDQKHSHAFIPFGGGGRICIGAPLAVLEATTVLQKLCERYQVLAMDQNPPEIEGLITAYTKSPLYVRLERRK